MECEAADELWRRSEQKIHLRYTEVISDGDSKTIAHLNYLKPYEGETVTKHECVGHVQKQVGTRVVKKLINHDKKVAWDKLKALKDQLKGLKEKTKGKGTGKGKGKQGKIDTAVTRIQAETDAVNLSMVEGVLNENTVDLLQVDYGNVVRAPSNDFEGMKQACWAVFYHSISTDQKPQHHCCPEGAESWCKFQRALALHQTFPPHNTKFQQTLSSRSDLCLTSYATRNYLGNACWGPPRTEMRAITTSSGLPKTTYYTIYYKAY